MKNVINNLYSVFNKYPLKGHIEGCPCCDLEETEKGLHTSELRNLNWEELGLFTFKSMTTFGDIEDFKHFLPRIFELYIQDIYEAPYDIGVLFSKLEYANWQEWAKSERDSVEITIQSWLKYLETSDLDADKEALQKIKEDMETYEFKFHA